MYDRILLPTDGSDTADLAAERAIDMAARHDAGLHVLYVAERTRDEPTRKGFDEKITEELQTGEDVLESVVDRSTEVGVETEETVTSGVPRTTIEEYADDHDIGLIVIGSTGASDVSEKLLGTVSKYIVNEAPADVFIVRPDVLLSDAAE
ncbi:universal stress protein [Natronorubrum texcoconense]|uniref:Nucleotide-binding universal stress protein, UspA family n=1 Tax=Natronorubrum texcoconense TaxID=1095776 RepID=A0A1G8VLX9_9EURY|nr:universal stress protein [Natronorubrum texcoconense]SDJ67066.1 Nucleotide-binding universal stress protein, UspA family [Natronorubrum texcoconense]